MPIPASPFSVRPSTLAALAVPLLGLLAGLALGLAATATPSLRSAVQSAFLVLLGAAACAWLRLDARERKHALGLSYFVGLLLAPVVAVPYYFNQTRERPERVKANIWFIALAVSTLLAFWLGAVAVHGAQ